MRAVTPDAAMATGTVVWITGRPSSGKSTLAFRLQEHLRGRGVAAIVLDGDDVRAAVVPGYGHDETGRDAFYDTLGNLAALLARQEHVVIVAATAHRRIYRERARRAATGSSERFVEVWVTTPAQECARRDHRGLYARARHGEIHDFPGLDDLYEEPAAPEVQASGGHDAGAVEAVVALLG